MFVLIALTDNPITQFYAVDIGNVLETD